MSKFATYDKNSNSSSAAAGLTTTQVSTLTTTQLDSLSTSQINNLTTTQVVALESTQISELISTDIQLLTSTDISTLTTTQIDTLDTTQINTLTTTQVGELITTNIQQLQTSQIAAIVDNQVTAIIDEVLDNTSTINTIVTDPNDTSVAIINHYLELYVPIAKDAFDPTGSKMRNAVTNLLYAMNEALRVNNDIVYNAIFNFVNEHKDGIMAHGSSMRGVQGLGRTDIDRITIFYGLIHRIATDGKNTPKFNEQNIKNILKTDYFIRWAKKKINK
jgi:hypothetical protein